MNMIVKSAAIAASSAMPVHALASDMRADLDRLWIERLRLMKEISSNSKRCAAQYEKLPDWANAGPDRIDCHGEKSGVYVGWPEIKTITKPTNEGAFRIIRPSPATVKWDYKQWVMIWGDGSGKARGVMRKRMREVIARIREQREEKAKLGIQELEAKSQSLCDQLFDVEAKIKALWTPQNAHALAAVVLIWSGHELSNSLTGADDELTCAVLSSIAPALGGPIAQSVAGVLELYGDETNPALAA